ncbi:MAG: N-acetylmuramoyl-L-alanine amidase [Bacteroides sp.]|nr:N-acetylmuramoyl-L-alanine amidase [Roseburia sp.]MCM1346575.1 N-acetylmuramoyl-L-alanine amidase [Bacteroides sp.]MCM1422133.1 N-acetylmuramoyl-L-alanine amidase [Bacteroides sp.]
MRLNIAVILLIAVWQCFSVRAEARKKDFVVVVDAGHGGKDAGASGRYAKEKDINLAISKKLDKVVRKNTKGIKVVMTRRKDEYVTLKDRAGFANFVNADLFISVHSNASEKNPNAYGTEVYVHRQSSAASERLARIIAEKLRTHARRNDKGVKKANFQVLRESTMPGVLVEVGFISNRMEEEFISSKNGVRLIAESIYLAVSEYVYGYAPSDIKRSRKDSKMARKSWRI